MTLPPLVTITPYSMESVGAGLYRANNGNGMQSVSQIGWPAANLALYFPFRVFAPFTLTELFWENGNTTTGNRDAGIYDEAGTRLISAGSTAGGSVLVQQRANVTDTRLYPGLYYLGMSSSNTSNNFWAMSNGSFRILTWLGVMQQASAHPLPATATFAAYAQAAVYVPMFGLTTRSV